MSRRSIKKLINQSIELKRRNEKRPRAYIRIKTPPNGNEVIGERLLVSGNAWGDFNRNEARVVCCVRYLRPPGCTRCSDRVKIGSKDLNPPSRTSWYVRLSDLRSTERGEKLLITAYLLPDMDSPVADALHSDEVTVTYTCHAPAQLVIEYSGSGRGRPLADAGALKEIGSSLTGHPSFATRMGEPGKNT
jgi:hypothetical protein